MKGTRHASAFLTVVICEEFPPFCLELAENNSCLAAIHHGVEIPFVFGFPFMNKTSFLKKLYRDHPLVIQPFSYPLDTNMSEFSMMLWTNFAKLGNPTPHEIQNVTWLPFTVDTQNYIHIYINSSIRQRFRQSHFAFWRERYSSIAEPAPREFFSFFFVSLGPALSER